GWQNDVNGPQSLTIDYRQNSNYKDIDVALYRPTNNISQNQYNAAKVTITNVSVQQLNPSSTAPHFDESAIPNTIHLVVELEVDRYIDKDQTIMFLLQELEIMTL